MTDRPASAIFEEALAHHQQGRPEEAERLYRETLALDPTHKQAWSNLGAILSRHANFEDAIACYKTALEIDPGFGECWFNLGNAFRRAGRPGEAEGAFVQAVKIFPGFEGAAFGLAQALSEQGKLTESVHLLRTIIDYNPGMADAHFHMGNTLRLQGRAEEALQSFAQYAHLKPNEEKARHQHGLSLMEMGRMEAALEEVSQALVINPQSPSVHNTLSIVLQSLGKEDLALRHNLEAVNLKNDFTEAWNNLGNLLGLMGQPDGSVSAFRKTIELRPGASAFHSNLLLHAHYHPEWTPEQHHEEHLNWARAHIGPIPIDPKFPNVPDPERKLKIGLVSPDFREHTVATFLEPFMTHLDRSQVEVVAYGAVGRPDETTKKFIRLADKYRDIYKGDDETVAAQIRGDEIDILIDFAGHTAGNRLSLFALRPAPIQMTQFGYPDTTGVPGIDFRVTDILADPPGKTEKWHTEKLLRMERLCWVYQPSPQAPPVPLRSADPNGIIFGSFNNMAKINDKVLALWARILAKVPGSKLHLLGGNSDTTGERIRAVLAPVGVDPERIERLPRMDKQTYFSAQGSIDIALDPFPYNGAITSCDALWMGTPVLALEGKSYVSRQGLAVLSPLGLDDWVAASEKEYLEKAVHFALNPGLLNQLRPHLRDSLARSAICDAAGYARSYENLIRTVWRNWCRART